jgi:hypothetical protein
MVTQSPAYPGTRKTLLLRKIPVEALYWADFHTAPNDPEVILLNA